MPRLFLLAALLLTGCATSNHEKKIPAGVSAGHQIPALDTGAVPQGLSYLEQQQCMLISYYFTDGRPSVIITMDWETGESIRTTVLKEPNGAPHNGHVGGIEIYESDLWVASGAFLYRFALDDVLHNDEATATGRFRTEATEEVAYCTIYEESIWAGEFALGNRYSTHTNHHLIARDGSERT